MGGTVLDLPRPLQRALAQVAINAGRERLSTAFFLDADYDCVVDPADIPVTCASRITECSPHGSELSLCTVRVALTKDFGWEVAEIRMLGVHMLLWHAAVSNCMRRDVRAMRSVTNVPASDCLTEKGRVFVPPSSRISMCTLCRRPSTVFSSCVRRAIKGLALQPPQPPITQGEYLEQRFRETMPSSPIVKQ